MDRQLVNLENKLNLDDKEKALTTIIMHTNLNNTNLLNVKQMRSYFLPLLKAYTYGKHDYDSDINGVTDYKRGLIKYFGKGLCHNLMSTNYKIVKNAYQTLKNTISEFQIKYSKTYHFTYKILTMGAGFYSQLHPTYINNLSANQKKAINNYYENSPRKIEIALDVVSASNDTMAFEDNTLYSRLDIIRFMNYFAKHPNTMFIPNHNATLADPLGCPDGTTPKECKENTKKYIKSLEHKVVMSPKRVLNYCKIHLNHLNQQIKLVAKRHPHIHYKKFLSNNLFNLKDITNTAYGSSKYNMSIEDGFNFIDQRDLDGKKLIDNNKDYHWVLNHFALLKKNYISLFNLQKQALHYKNYCYSFASDIVNQQQLSNTSTVADYFKYTKMGRRMQKK